MKKIRLVTILIVLCLIHAASVSQNNSLPKARLNHTAIYVVDLKKSGDFYTQITTKSLKANLDLVSQRLDSTKRIMERSEMATANEMDISNKIIRFSGKVNEVRLRKETELLNMLYAELLKNKEIAKFNYDQEKPIFLKL